MAKFSKQKHWPDGYEILSFGDWQGLKVKTIAGWSRDGFINRPIDSSPNPVHFTKSWCNCTAPVGADVSRAAGAFQAHWQFDRALLEASNAAYAKLRKRVGTLNAGLGMDLATLNQTTGMFVNASKTLGNAWSNLRRGNLLGFFQALGHHGLPPAARSKKYKGSGNWYDTRKRVYQQSSDLWLEFHFGWVPFVEDMFTAVKVLQGPKSSATYVFGSSTKIIDGYTQYYAGEYPYAQMSGSVRVKMCCRVYVTNPNAYLVQQLGLANPAHVVWDAIPFSFVLDWFFTVGKFLESLDDFFGLTQLDPYTLTFYRGKDSADGVYPRLGYTQNSESILMLGDSSPISFRWNPYPRSRIGSAVWKATTSLALLTQKLRHRL